MPQLNEELLRLAARLAAQEAYRLSRPDVARGQESATQGRLAIDTVAVPLSSAVTVPIGGPIRSFAVLSGGHSDVTLRCIGYDRRVVNIPADPATAVQDVAIRQLVVVVPAGLTGTIRLLTSEAPFAIGAPCCGGNARTQGEDALGPEHTVQYVDADAAGAGVSVELEAGFVYELAQLTAELIADANAATRTLTMQANQEDGATPLQTTAEDLPGTRTANQSGIWHFGPGFGVDTARAGGTNQIVSELPRAWVGRIPAGQAALVAFVFAITNGQATDQCNVVSTWKRRRIL